MEKASTPRNRLTRSAAKQVNSSSKKLDQEDLLDQVEDTKPRKSSRRKTESKPKTNGESLSNTDRKKSKNFDELSDETSLDGCESEESGTSMKQKNSPKSSFNKTSPVISRKSLRTRSTTPVPDSDTGPSKRMRRSTSEGKLESTPTLRRSGRAKSESKDFVFTPTKGRDSDKISSASESNSAYAQKNSALLRVIDRIVEANEEESCQNESESQENSQKSLKSSERNDPVADGDTFHETTGKSENQPVDSVSISKSDIEPEVVNNLDTQHKTDSNFKETDCVDLEMETDLPPSVAETVNKESNSIPLPPETDPVSKDNDSLSEDEIKLSFYANQSKIHREQVETLSSNNGQEDSIKLATSTEDPTRVKSMIDNCEVDVTSEDQDSPKVEQNVQGEPAAENCKIDVTPEEEACLQVGQDVEEISLKLDASPGCPTNIPHDSGFEDSHQNIPADSVSIIDNNNERPAEVTENENPDETKAPNKEITEQNCGKIQERKSTDSSEETSKDDITTVIISESENSETCEVEEQIESNNDDIKYNNEESMSQYTTNTRDITNIPLKTAEMDDDQKKEFDSTVLSPDVRDEYLQRNESMEDNDNTQVVDEVPNPEPDNESKGYCVIVVPDEEPESPFDSDTNQKSEDVEVGEEDIKDDLNIEKKNVETVKSVCHQNPNNEEPETAIDREDSVVELNSPIHQERADSPTDVEVQLSAENQHKRIDQNTEVDDSVTVQLHSPVYEERMETLAVSNDLEHPQTEGGESSKTINDEMDSPTEKSQGYVNPLTGEVDSYDNQQSEKMYEYGDPQVEEVDKYEDAQVGEIDKNEDTQVEEVDKYGDAQVEETDGYEDINKYEDPQADVYNCIEPKTTVIESERGDLQMEAEDEVIVQLESPTYQERLDPLVEVGEQVIHEISSPIDQEKEDPLAGTEGPAVHLSSDLILKDLAKQSKSTPSNEEIHKIDEYNRTDLQEKLEDDAVTKLGGQDKTSVKTKNLESKIQNESQLDKSYDLDDDYGDDEEKVQDSGSDSDIYKGMSDFGSEVDEKKDGSEYYDSGSTERRYTGESEEYVSSLDEEHYDEENVDQENVPSNNQKTLQSDQKTNSSDKPKDGEKASDRNSPMTYDKALAILNKNRVKKIDDEEFFDMFTQELNRVSEESGSDSDIAIVDEYIMEPEPEKPAAKPNPKSGNPQINIKPPQRPPPPSAPIPNQPDNPAGFSGNYNQQGPSQHHNHPVISRVNFPQGGMYHHQYNQGMPPINSIRGPVMYDQFAPPTNVSDPRIYNPHVPSDVNFSNSPMFNHPLGTVSNAPIQYTNAPALKVRSLTSMNSSHSSNAMDQNYVSQEQMVLQMNNLREPGDSKEILDDERKCVSTMTDANDRSDQARESAPGETSILKLLGLDKDKLKLLKQVLGINKEEPERELAEKKAGKSRRSKDKKKLKYLQRKQMEEDRIKKTSLIKQILEADSSFVQNKIAELSTAKSSSSSDQYFQESSSDLSEKEVQREIVNYENGNVSVTIGTIPRKGSRKPRHRYAVHKRPRSSSNETTTPSPDSLKLRKKRHRAKKRRTDKISTRSEAFVNNKMTVGKIKPKKQPTILKSQCGTFTVDSVTATSQSSDSEAQSREDRVAESSDSQDVAGPSAYNTELKRDIRRNIATGKNKLSNMFTQHSSIASKKGRKRKMDDVYEEDKKTVKKLEKLPCEILEKLAKEESKAKRKKLEDSASEESTLQKSKKRRKRSSRVKVKSSVASRNYIPIVTTGATQFSLSRLDKDLDLSAAEEAAKFRNDRLYGSTVKRITILDFKR